MTFHITNDNTIAAVTNPETMAATTDTETFSSQDELARLAASWPMARFVLIWNQLPNIAPIKRFMNRNAAITRIWNQIKTLTPSRPKPVPADANGKHRASKKARVLAMLVRPEGATITELMTATGWQIHSVRGFLSTMTHKHGVTITADGKGVERIYRITN